MINSLNSSAVNLITNAQHKAADAAHTISRLAISEDEVGSTDFDSRNLANPLLSLKGAELETSAAVKILEVEQETLGSLFDATA